MIHQKANTEVLDARADHYEGRKDRKINRYNELADKHQKLSADACEQSIAMAKCIPMGQPIMVGHHSEGRDRRFRQKIGDKMGQSVKHAETAEYYANKAYAAEHNSAIFSDDPDAIAKLKKQIENGKNLQEGMKAANKIVKSKKLTNEQKIQRLIETGHDPAILEPLHGIVGYYGYQLSNNNANIKRLEQRLVQLEKSLVAATELGDTEMEYPQFELVVGYARSINRLQLRFEGKPSAEIRDLLKKNGFKWAPSQNSWQRFLSTSRYALSNVLSGLEKSL